MMRTVLLALDRSDKDARAVRAAEAFAELIDANIHVVHVLGGVPGVDPAEISDTATARQDQARDWLAAIQAGVRPATGRQVTSELIVSLGYADTIAAVAQTIEPEMIVMATRAAGNLGRAIHGSVADRVVRESTRPVALVPPPAGHAGALDRPFRKVLLPLDESRDATRALDRLLALSREGTLHFVLLQVVKAEATGGYMLPSPSASHAERDRAIAELGAIAEQIRRQRSGAEVHVVESACPDDEIVKLASAQSVDFIAMTTRSPRGLSRWLIGSVADGVTQKSTVPVLIMA